MLFSFSFYFFSNVGPFGSFKRTSLITRPFAGVEAFRGVGGGDTTDGAAQRWPRHDVAWGLGRVLINSIL